MTGMQTRILFPSKFLPKIAIEHLKPEQKLIIFANNEFHEQITNSNKKIGELSLIQSNKQLD